MNIEKIEKENVEDMIYEVRGVQVMLDSDLAKLYKCDTGNLNRARSRNNKRFPENFAFQITREEYVNLKCQFGISKVDLRKINRNLPYVYTEQGVAMLSSVLHTDIAIDMSVKIINAFVKMRRYFFNGLREINVVNSKLLEYDNRISLLENTLSKLNEKQKVNTIFYEGQIYDAYVVLMEVLESAKEEIIIIDDYAGKELFKIVKDIDKKIIVITSNIDETAKKKYENQYRNIKIKQDDKFHDRFIILDRKVLYHSGASFKDLGKKCCCLSLIENQNIIHELLKEIGL